MNTVWEGPRTKIERFNQKHELVQIGWWYEPQAAFVPINSPQPGILGSASPVYCEVGID